MTTDKTILTEADLIARWGASLKVIARHRAKGLRGFRVAHKKPGVPGQALWRYHLSDVLAYEEQLKDEALPPPKVEPETGSALGARSARSARGVLAGTEGPSLIRGAWGKRRGQGSKG